MQTTEASKAEANKELIRSYLESASGEPKSVEALREQVSSETLLEHIEMFEAAFPRYEMFIEDMIAEEDKVVVRARFRGTHQGEFAGLAPTGRTVEAAFIAIYQISGHNITDFWAQADAMSLMQQLGSQP